MKLFHYHISHCQSANPSCAPVWLSPRLALQYLPPLVVHLLALIYCILKLVSVSVCLKYIRVEITTCTYNITMLCITVGYEANQRSHLIPRLHCKLNRTMPGQNQNQTMLALQYKPRWPGLAHHGLAQLGRCLHYQNQARTVQIGLL